MGKHCTRGRRAEWQAGRMVVVFNTHGAEML